jgi:exonuclease III
MHNFSIRVGTLYVGTMTGKSREVVDMMDRRKLDVLFVQETKWKRSKARELGQGYKLYYTVYDLSGLMQDNLKVDI